MLKDIFGKSEKPKPQVPVKERRDKAVPVERFNSMIDYYTAELRSRLTEIASLKAENEMLIKTSLKNASRSDELRIQVQKLQEQLRLIEQKQK